MTGPDFDLSTLERIERQLGEDRVRDVIALFLEHTPDRLRRVRHGVSSGDLNLAAEALHSLKSSAAMLGAEQLGRIAQSMEQTAREGRREVLAAQVPYLEGAARVAGAILSRRLGGWNR